MSSLNSRNKQSNFIFKKRTQYKYEHVKSVSIEPFVKLKNVWFSKEQNDIVISMYLTMFVIGIIIGLTIGLIF